MSDTQLAPNMPKWMVDHTELYLKSGGKEGHMYKITLPNLPEREVPSLLLTTVGRKSGKKYLFPLFYGRHGGSYYIVASKGGAPEHPGWFHNLLANPEVEIQVGTEKMNAKARIAEGAERQAMWTDALTFWPPYADYQAKATSRQIPVVVLDPIR